MQKNEYYVYVYIHPDTGDCFYVGKGKGKRDTSHLREVLNSKNPRKKTQKEKFFYLYDLVNSGKIPIIKRVIENLTEKDSLVIETLLIDFYGLSDDGGQLLNKKSKTLFSKALSYSISDSLKTFYSENPGTRKGVKTPEEVKAKQSLARKRFFENGGKNWCDGIKMSEEFRKANSEGQKKRFQKQRQHNALYWVTPEGIFSSKKLAAEATGLTEGQIRVRCQMDNDLIPTHNNIKIEISKKYGEDKVGLSWKEIGFYTQSHL